MNYKDLTVEVNKGDQLYYVKLFELLEERRWGGLWKEDDTGGNKGEEDVKRKDNIKLRDNLGMN